MLCNGLCTFHVTHTGLIRKSADENLVIVRLNKNENIRHDCSDDPLRKTGKISVRRLNRGMSVDDDVPVNCSDLFCSKFLQALLNSTIKFSHLVAVLDKAFRSSDGFLILRGRDTRGNGLALKLAAPHDYWIHTADGPSAHVIIRRDHAGQQVPERTLHEAGILAAQGLITPDDTEGVMIAGELGNLFDIDEDLYFSILPTATQYARNAIFSGLMPNKIAQMFPDLWVDEDEEEGKNLNEAPLIQTQLDRFRKRYTFSYHKINESAFGEKLIQNFTQLENNQLNVCVLNFVDMLSHARTESKMIRELASTEAAYRSITESWFKHSSALDLFRKIAEKDFKIILTTDHGTVHVNNPIKVIGDKNTNTNLRYKVGKSLSYNPKQVYEIKSPERYGLPSPNISSTYIFATNHDFFAYPNNYNYYVGYYKDTFQHGGISMEEMMIPLITLTKK